ncbi:MAG: hypothetical protein K2N80_05025 [Lachnospiraceae bacterium]|nr:hypothetical protein [Lachnospiraceae bacterium]
MGNETIFYYVTEEAVTGHKRAVKLHFWQRMKFTSFVVEKNEMTVAAIMIPAVQKGWKSEKLLRLMWETAEKHPLYSGNIRILIQPDVQFLLTEQKHDVSETSKRLPQSVQSDTFLSIGFPMSEKILREQFPLQNRRCGPESVVLLLGELFFPEEQIRHFGEMIQPYLPRVNALTVIYGAEDSADQKTETELFHAAEMQSGTGAEMVSDSFQESGRLGEVIQEYTEELYYEYGLVSQILCGRDIPANRIQCGRNGLVKRNSLSGGQSPVLFLDYGYPDLKPLRMLKEGDIYLDVASSEEKEALFRRKYRGIFYQSPRKYLDTMVKSGYDK